MIKLNAYGLPHCSNLENLVTHRIIVSLTHMDIFNSFTLKNNKK